MTRRTEPKTRDARGAESQGARRGRQQDVTHENEAQRPRATSDRNDDELEAATEPQLQPDATQREHVDDDAAGWKRVSDELPTVEVPLGQATVLFCRAGWAAPILGLFTWRGPAEHCAPGEPLYDWAELDVETGHYVEFASSLSPEQTRPTYWLPVPEVPWPKNL